jgi:hypothetical protein
VFTALTVSRLGPDRVRFCRQNTQRLADAVRRILENGYVNVCGVVLSLLPELGEGANAAPVLQAMEIHGTWILPYNAAKIPSLWEDFVSTLAENTRRYLRDEDDQSEEEETPSGKITWELRCKRADDGWLSALIPMYIKTAYREEPAFRDSKVVYSLYEKAFNRNFSDRYPEIIPNKDMQPGDVGTFSTPIDFNSVMKKAIDFSDGVICNAPAVDASLPAYAKQKGIPVLEGDASTMAADVINDFYNKI